MDGKSTLEKKRRNKRAQKVQNFFSGKGRRRINSTDSLPSLGAETGLQQRSMSFEGKVVILWNYIFVGLEIVVLAVLELSVIFSRCSLYYLLITLKLMRFFVSLTDTPLFPLLFLEICDISQLLEIFNSSVLCN